MPPAVTEPQVLDALRPIEDPDNVDERRANVGLGTLEEYRQMMRSHAGG